MMLTYGSVCSGIEAASVAWEPLGFKAAWLSEIEAFPSAVLAHHYPTVPNLGDMRTITRRVLTGEVPAPDILVGGTPCQAFSIAGLREGLDDERGQLTLTYMRLLDAIDFIRGRNGLEPCIAVWENVPGVLSDKTNAFGCFLAGLAGEDVELQPAGKKWTNAGCVFGPERAIAWRTLDAQYFGLAQRRRRVFLVASARKGFDPSKVLFEFDGMRRDSPPSRQAGQNVTGTLASRTTGGGGLGTDFDVDGGLQPYPDSPDVARTLLAKSNDSLAEDMDTYTPTTARCLSTSNQRIDWETETFVAEPAYSIQAGALRINPNSGPDGMGVNEEIAYTLEARAEVQAVCAPAVLPFDTTQITSATNRCQPDYGDPCHPLAAGAHAPAIAFSCKDYGNDAATEIAPTMRAMNHTGSHANAGGQLAVCVTGDVAHTLKADGFDASEDGTGRGQPIVAHFVNARQDPVSALELCGPLDTYGGTNAVCVAFQDRFRGDDGRGYARVPPVSEEIIGTLETVKPWNVSNGMRVRRLTPIECERLQGFPDDYTSIPTWNGWRKMDASETPESCIAEGLEVKQNAKTGKWRVKDVDGPRYKALGNSMATTCMKWLGVRIVKYLKNELPRGFL